MLKNFIGGFFLGCCLFVILGFALLLGGCSKASSQEDLLIGKWQKPGQPVTMHFFETGDMDYVHHGKQLAGTYRWIDDTRIRFGAGHSEAAILEIHIEGDTLTTKTATATETWNRIE